MKPRSPDYLAWRNMIQRCADATQHRYGGRGIRVCAEWLGASGFLRFIAHVGRRPTSDHSLDRIDVDGDYEPGNVRWATEREQQRNRANNHMVTVGDRTMCLAAWAEASGVRRGTLAQRLEAGVAPERAIDPRPISPKHMFRGRERSSRQIAIEMGIPENSLLRRIARHGDVETAIAAWQRNSRGKRPVSSEENEDLAGRLPPPTVDLPAGLVPGSAQELESALLAPQASAGVPAAAEARLGVTQS